MKTCVDITLSNFEIMYYIRNIECSILTLRIPRSVALECFMRIFPVIVTVDADNLEHQFGVDI